MLVCRADGRDRDSRRGVAPRRFQNDIGGNPDLSQLLGDDEA